MSLINQSELESRLGRSLTTDEASAFTIINSANQAYVEKLIGSKLETVSETTRYYDGGRQFLKIDPCTDITSVKLVDTDDSEIETIDDDYYVQDPINATLKTQITYRYGKLDDGYGNIAVTAKFSIAGDTDVVAVVKSAMLDALESEIDNSDDIIRESIEGYSVELAQSETKNSLDKIKYLFPEVM